jgi:hypothetical protein
MVGLLWFLGFLMSLGLLGLLGIRAGPGPGLRLGRLGTITHMSTEVRKSG